MELRNLNAFIVRNLAMRGKSIVVKNVRNIKEMKVYKHRKLYSEHKPELHAVTSKDWVTKDDPTNLLELKITTYCKEVYYLNESDLFEDYNKETHRKKLCRYCVEEITNLMKRQGRSVPPLKVITNA